MQAAVLLALAARGADGVVHIGFGHGSLQAMQREKASIFISPSNCSVKIGANAQHRPSRAAGSDWRPLPRWPASALPVRAQHKGPWLADMHSHYGQFLPRLFGLDLARHMSETGTTLLAWAVDGRPPLDRPDAARLAAAPGARAGRAVGLFQQRLAGYEARLAGWNVHEGAHAGRRGRRAGRRAARAACHRGRELPGGRARAGGRGPRAGHPPHAAGALHPEPAGRSPDGRAAPRRPDADRREGRGGMQAMGHRGRPGARHAVVRRRRCRCVGRRDGLVAFMDQPARRQLAGRGLCRPFALPGGGAEDRVARRRRGPVDRARAQRPGLSGAQRPVLCRRDHAHVRPARPGARGVRHRHGRRRARPDPVGLRRPARSRRQPGAARPVRRHAERHLHRQLRAHRQAGDERRGQAA